MTTLLTSLSVKELVLQKVYRLGITVADVHVRWTLCFAQDNEDYTRSIRIHEGQKESFTKEAKLAWEQKNSVIHGPARGPRVWPTAEKKPQAGPGRA